MIAAVITPFTLEDRFRRTGISQRPKRREMSKINKARSGPEVPGYDNYMVHCADAQRRKWHQDEAILLIKSWLLWLDWSLLNRNVERP